ncbi:hypothetical protein BSKO_07588 [Bryopsis sp. KO-2023]|nr:hypothetical protein BSKO_07588 [Bryopsis sp. KO-2023]
MISLLLERVKSVYNSTYEASATATATALDTASAAAPACAFATALFAAENALETASEVAWATAEACPVALPAPIPFPETDASTLVDTTTFAIAVPIAVAADPAAADTSALGSARIFEQQNVRHGFLFKKKRNTRLTVEIAVDTADATLFFIVERAREEELDETVVTPPKETALLKAELEAVGEGRELPCG